MNEYVFYATRSIPLTGRQLKNDWSFNYRRTGMGRNEWLAIKLLRMLKKQKRYPIKWVETRDKITITFK